MRVLQIVKGLDIGSIHGGAERFALELTAELKRAGVDISVCAFFRTRTAAEEKWRGWLEAAQIPCWSASDWAGSNNMSSYWAGVREMRRQLSAQPVDICHSHFQLGSIGALGMKAAGLTRRVVRTCHVTQEWDYGWYGWLRERVFSHWLFPLFVDAEVGVSGEITSMLAGYAGNRLFRRRPVYIPNALPRRNRAAPPLAPRPITGSPIIGTVGRLSEVKCQHHLLEAGRIVREVFPGLQIWLIGDGDLRHDLERQAEALGLGDSVRFFGQRDDALDLLAQMDVFVITSRREGLPTVVLESFSQGVPVVGTDVSGIRELVHPGETGWLVPPADPARLADTIITALKDETGRARVAQAGREAVRSFEIEAVAGRYLDLYRQVMGQGL